MQSFLIAKPISSAYTAPEAFFLGGMIMCCDESFGSDFVSLVRHNPGFVGSKQIAAHRKAIELLAEKAGGRVTNLSSRKFDGFAVHFSSRTDSEQTLIKRADCILKHGSLVARTALLSGVFDGRASFDRKKGTAAATQFVVDCPRNCEDQVANLVVELARQFGILVTANFSRDRLSGGNPRKTQLRMRSTDAERFFTQIGLVSPAKIERAQEMYGAAQVHEKDHTEMPGLLVINKLWAPRQGHSERPQQSTSRRHPLMRPIEHEQAARPIPTHLSQKDRPTSSTQTTRPSSLTRKKKWLTQDELAKIKVGITVTHRTFGCGIVTSLEDGHITVRLNGKERMFSYPGAFEDGFLYL